ncbi:MAG: hypothetical protein BWX67_02241 [Thermotogae bacterium ADurb.Bin062]|nr:MAG: hypothetical protein BWX67_02241 [Thermotogota bacterium ADurb.Bin062]
MAKGGDRGVVKTTYPAITPHGHHGASASSFRDGAIPQFRSFEEQKTGFAQRAQRTQRKDRQWVGIAGSLRLPRDYPPTGSAA